MGIFGAGPFDGDDAAEFLDKVFAARGADAIASRIRREVLGVAEVGESDRYITARAAAQFVVLAHKQASLPSLLDVVRLLAHIRGDREWIAAWYKPKKIAKALDLELMSVLATMSESGCTKGDVRDARMLVRAALEAPVSRHEKHRMRRSKKKARPARKGGR